MSDDAKTLCLILPRWNTMKLPIEIPIIDRMITTIQIENSMRGCGYVFLFLLITSR